MTTFYDQVLRRLPESVKVGINLPIMPPALEKCIEINSVLRALAPSPIDFRPHGTSSPHVTVAMGTICSMRMRTLVETLAQGAIFLREPVRMSFSRPYRETVTGRYVLADVFLDELVSEWRIDMMRKFASMFSDIARTSDRPHLTLGLAECHTEKVDTALRSADWSIPPCTVDRLHVSLSGARGVKSDVIAAVAIANN